MICVRCGNPNPPGSNYCSRCHAVLPRIDSGEPSSSFAIEDGREYLVPERSYPTEHVYHLTCRAWEYIHQEAPGEPLLEAFEVVRGALDRFESEDLPDLLVRFEEGRAKEPDDDYWTQLPYLMKRGITMMREGFARMETFVGDGDVDTLKSAVERIQEGNDHLGLARELATQRMRRRRAR